MNKISIIISREFTTRVRKKSFLIVTIFVPILFAIFYLFLMWMLFKEDNQKRTIAVINESTLEKPIEQINNTNFVYLEQDVNESEYATFLKEHNYYAITRIPQSVMQHAEVYMYSLAPIPLELKNEITIQVQRQVEEKKRSDIIAQSNIPDLDKKLRATRTPVLVRTLVVSESGDSKESSSEITSLFGLVGGLIIYIFIFMYSSQVMKGVVEEKTNRIIEVLVSSVKPFQFLLGKIIGVAAVGLLQFLIWIGVGAIIITVSKLVLLPGVDLAALRGATDLTPVQGINMQPEQLAIVQYVVKTIEPSFILEFMGAFLFYFIGGYLLYASLFAAIGAAVDSETDTQQFMTPLSIILIVSLYIGISAMKNPESSLVFWSSLIPFTSPVVMLTRIPFGIPTWEIILSMVLLVLAFLFFTWLSGKIYRVGILMYGKKVTWKELYKWLKYKG
ncbi:MAG: ABC transporter permease [Marinifilaceae bacterium]|nr:ABC transporter permease [Marinifilaceae bacterium]